MLSLIRRKSLKSSLSIPKRSYRDGNLKLSKNTFEPVQVTLEELKNVKDKNYMLDKIEKAYSRDGLGLIIIKGSPNFYEKKLRLYEKNFILANKDKEYHD